MLPAFLAILLSLLVAQTSAACEQGISFRGGPCSCYSGYTGSDCSVNSAGSCNITTPVDYLTTEIVAEFKKSWSTISNNYFTFTLVSNPRLNRTFVSIAANNETTCAYPSPTFFTRTFNTTSCQDTFVGNISIPDLVQTCTFTRTEETGRTVLSGSIRVTAIDPLGDFRGQSLVRTTNSILKLRLNLPTLYNVTSQPLTLYSAINLLSAVTLQEYNPNTDTATVEITSSLQWPYQLSAPTLEINPYASTAGFGVNFAILDVAGCQTANAPCTQVSRLTITGVAASKTCVFSGLYGLSWAYGFRSGASPAELPANPTVKTNVTLASDNVCTEIQIDARLSADIQSYSDATFAATKLAYLAGNTIFFKASVTADVNVNSVSVANLWINIGNTTTVTLVANSAPSLTYASANFNGSLGNTSPSEVGFSFVATFGEAASNIFSSTNRDAVFSFQVQAELQVSYVTSFKKRDVEIENIVVKKQVVLDTFAIRRAGQNALPAAGAPAAVFETPNSASGLTFGLAAPLVVGVAGALAANN